MSCAPFLIALSSSGKRYDSVSRESSVHSMISISSPLMKSKIPIGRSSVAHLLYALQIGRVPGLSQPGPLAGLSNRSGIACGRPACVAAYSVRVDLADHAVWLDQRSGQRISGRLRTGARSSTRSIASIQRPSAARRLAALSGDNAPARASRSIVRRDSTSSSSLEHQPLGPAQFRQRSGFTEDEPEHGRRIDVDRHRFERSSSSTARLDVPDGRTGVPRGRLRAVRLAGRISSASVWMGTSSAMGVLRSTTVIRRPSRTERRCSLKRALSSATQTLVMTNHSHNWSPRQRRRLRDDGGLRQLEHRGVVEAPGIPRQSSGLPPSAG